MIALTSTTRQLELDLTGASSLPCTIVVSFSDRRYFDGSIAIGTTLSSSNGTSDVIICDNPPSGMVRIIDTISVHNPNGSSVTARIYYDESNTELRSFKQH